MNKFLKLLFSVFLFLLFETSISYSEETRIKIGVLAPLSGENASLGKQILNLIRMALIDIKNNNIEIYPKDTRSNPEITLRSALELEKMGISLVIGPVFHKNLLLLISINAILIELSICFPKDAFSPDSGTNTPILIFDSSE